MHRCGDHSDRSGSIARPLELRAAYQVRARGPTLPAKSHHRGPDVSDAVADISNVEDALDFIESAFAYQIAVSNVGELLYADKESAVRITSMWGPSNLLGFEGEQLVGAITINGCLHLLHTAYSPPPTPFWRE